MSPETETQGSASSDESTRRDSFKTGADGLNGEIDLLALISVAWRRWRIIVISTVVALLGSVIYLRLTVPLYTAQLALVPAQDAGVSSSRRLGGLMSIASIAGIGLPSDEAGMSFLLYKEGVNSRMVADALSGQQDVMHTIFASEWDPDRQRFSGPPRGFVHRGLDGIKSLIGFRSEAWREPDALRLQEYLSDRVRVREDPDTPVVRLSFSHEDPAFSAKLLMRIHTALDDGLRERARRRAAVHISHLSSQMQLAKVVEHRNAIAQSLSEQEKNLMMASSSLSYAAEPLDSVLVSARPTHPRPQLVLALAIVVGSGLGFVLALAVTFMSARHERGSSPGRHPSARISRRD